MGQRFGSPTGNAETEGPYRVPEKVRRGALQDLAEKWPDAETLNLLESQLDTFDEPFYRRDVEMRIESVREKLGE